MQYQKRGDWEPIVKLGEGGQGDVFLACNASKASLQLADFEDIAKFLESIKPHNESLARCGGEKRFEQIKFSSRLAAVIARAGYHIRLGALKILKDDATGWVRDPKNAEARFRSELEVLCKVEHPNLIRLLDSSQDQKWFVTAYHRNGTLDEHIALFKERSLDALRAFRGLVDAVAHLHRLGVIHRDIKPQNIFLGDSGQLILGDMGLVHATDDAGERLTNTFSNVGTRDWMPPWAIGRRQEEVTFAFDVYALGKILWAMAVGASTCPAYHSPGALESESRVQSSAKAIDRILSQCVVAKEEDCLSDADSLLELVDDAIADASGVGRPIYLKMAAHALSRPGEPYLFSADWPLDSPAPVTTKSASWQITHPRVSGRGYQPGVIQPGGPTIVPSNEWQNFADFREESKQYHRWLLTMPEPRSSDNLITCDFPPIPLELARYFQFAVCIDHVATFRAYLGFDGPKWIAYSPGTGVPQKENDAEYRIPVSDLSHDGMVMAIRDILRDRARTWGDAPVGPLIRIRFRGAFKLLFARIV